MIVPTLFIAACGIGPDTVAPTIGSSRPQTGLSNGTHAKKYRPPQTAATKTVISPDGRVLVTIDRDGKYLVGFTYGDIPKGRYRNSGGRLCYWARLRSLDQKDVIESRQTSGPQEVQIRASDVAFLTRNCGTWQFTSLF